MEKLRNIVKIYLRGFVVTRNLIQFKNFIREKLIRLKVRRADFDFVSYDFQDVLITPFQQLLNQPSGGEFHQGGPIWPNWQRQTGARFCRDEVPQDVKPRVTDDVREEIGERCVWIGPLINHFGHQVADFGTRIFLSSIHFPDSILLFGAMANTKEKTAQAIPIYLQDILSFYGVQLSNVRIIQRTTLVSKLVTVKQPEQLMFLGPNQGYLNQLTQYSSQKLANLPEKFGKVFVVRDQMKTHFAGESYFVRLLEHTGNYIVRPEQISILKQLEIYSNCENLFMMEGSAIHGLQLLGEISTDVHILNRRPFSRLAEASIKYRTKSLSYHNISKTVVCGVNSRGEKEDYAGIPVFNLKKLRKFLQKHFPEVLELWIDSDFRLEEERDLRKWLEMESGSYSRHPLSHTAINMKLKQIGYKQLQVQ